LTKYRESRESYDDLLWQDLRRNRFIVRREDEGLDVNDLAFSKKVCDIADAVLMVRGELYLSKENDRKPIKKKHVVGGKAEQEVP
jgi:predicted nucleic-acid-binding protein